MTSQRNPDAASATATLFNLPLNALSKVDVAAKERGRMGGAWDSETRLQMLALEFARYMPDAAEQLAEAGKRKLLAA